MLKKAMFICTLISTITLAHAETCPSVHDIHNNNLYGWNAYTIDNATPLSAEGMKKFSHDVRQFSLAEWMDQAPEGSAHCYYEEKASHEPRYAFAYLAKHDLIADKTSSKWNQVGHDTVQCSSGINECRFINK